MAQSTKVHREYMRNRREVHKKEVEGSQTVWEQLCNKVESIKLSDGQEWHPDYSCAFIKPIVPLKRSSQEKLARKLIDPSWRELLEYLCENLKPEEANDVRVGCYGLTISEIKTLLPNIG